MDDHHSPKIPIYFRVGARLKRVTFSLSHSTTELKDIFLSKYPEILTEIKNNNPNITPSEIHQKISFNLQDKETHEQFELENTNDLYPNAILEYRDKKVPEKSKSVPNKKEIGISSFKLPWLLKRGLVIVTVGLPGRGKSFVSKKLENYLNWVGVSCRVFNLGDYRRKQTPSSQSTFDPKTEDGSTLLLSMAALALDEMVTWLASGEGKVGIYDGTNLRRDRRRAIMQRCKQEKLQVMFLESIIEDSELVEKNLLSKLENSSDYSKMDKKDAREHFQARLEYFLKYEEPITQQEMDGNYTTTPPITPVPSISHPNLDNIPLISVPTLTPTLFPASFSKVSLVSKSGPVEQQGREEGLVDIRRTTSNTAVNVKDLNLLSPEEMAVVKLYDLGRRIVVHNVHSYVPCRIVFFLKQLHRHERVIWLTRHGETYYASQSRVGGDSGLTEKGELFAHKLADWIPEHAKKYTQGKISVWTSSLKRTIETAQYIPYSKTEFRSLDEISAGEYDGLSYEEIEKTHPEEFKARANNKLAYRYPRGESYVDVIERLEPLMFELERQTNPVLIVSHQAVLRCIYGYLTNVKPQQIPTIEIPTETVIEILPNPYKSIETRYKLI